MDKPLFFATSAALPIVPESEPTVFGLLTGEFQPEYVLSGNVALADQMDLKPEEGLRAREGEIVKPLPAAVVENLDCEEGLKRLAAGEPWKDKGRGLALGLAMEFLSDTSVSGEMEREPRPKRWGI